MNVLHRMRPGRTVLATLALIIASLVAVFLMGKPFQAADTQVPAQKFELRQGDHISIIGNTLADRMQHDGWLDTMLHSRFPRHDLVIRNLGFSGDEVPLSLRLRSSNFGTPDQWLTMNKTDVIFAFFGYNESFAGQAGLDKFKGELDNFVKQTLAQKYNGKGVPRLVLFSSIAQEDLRDRNLPNGKENNQRIELYTKAMADVAAANKIAFVDLYKPTLEQYAKATKPFTINGIHLNELGNKMLAQVIEKALFAGQAEPDRPPQTIEKLRQAVLEKNFYWFNRYRTTDGFSIYGGRADLKFVDGQTNRVVMQREMEVLDAMTANRDKRIWAVAQGGDLKADDSNTPDFIPVKTNKPGAGPGGLHVFLDGQDAINKMTIAKGMKVNLFASEQQFPELANPVQMSWDAKGRLWVAAWPTYPHWKPKEEMNDKLLILEDTDGDGKADKCTTFAGDLHNPTGFEFYNGGVLVAMAPDLLFLKDTNGDDKADVRVRVLSGIDSADTHHTANSFALDPGGALYFQEGTFHHTQVETPYGPPQRCANAGVFRYEPRAQKFDVYITFGFANPHGHVFDRWGQDIVVDGTGANPYHAALFSGHLDFPQKHARPPQVYQQRTRPCPGMETLSSRHFPEENQGNLLVPNVIGFQGILQYKVADKDASFTAAEVEPILSSTDPNFRPSDVKMGPDGAIYFIDWHNPIIGHMQHNLRDPSRDRSHGRIYRVTAENRPLLKPAKIAGEPIDKLLALLKEPEDRVRYRARIELGARNSDEVVAATKKWIASLDQKDAEYEHHMMEALWMHQYHNVVDVELLKRMLGSKEFRARAAATRVLCYWRDRVPDALELFKKLAADQHPRVRLEAIRAASFFTVPEAVEVVLISAELATDPYLDFVRGETMKALDPLVKQTLAAGQRINFTTDAGHRYVLRNTSTDDLLKMKRDRAVNLELLFRKGVRDEFRRDAITSLAKLDSKSEMNVLLDAIQSQDAPKATTDETIVIDLIRLLTTRPAKELQGIRPELEKMALAARSPVTRQLGFVALISADGDVEKSWALAGKSTAGLRDLVSAMPFIRDPGVRANLYPKVEPLLQGLPKELMAVADKEKTTKGRFVRIEIIGRQKTLTLAEVEVISGGRNVARQGKASQKNTSHGGDAAKAIDGNKSGKFADGGQTHSQENTPSPWWEVDLGSEFPIESIAIYNRTDDGLGKRLDGFTLKVFDSTRHVVFARDSVPAPAQMVELKLGEGNAASVIRQAAMNALTYVRGQEEKTFKLLAKHVRDDVDRHAAVQAIQRIPHDYWLKDEIKPLLDSILGYIRKLPPQERTSPAALDALQLGDTLAAALPILEAKEIRKQLGELGVRVIRMGAVPDQMIFDKERFVVQAGKPAEIIFENTDLMPHNFVIVQPGALEEIGMLAENTATQPGAAERHYVPASGKILLSSRLIQPRDLQRLSFTAPKQPGVYPYVCTYPGHWRRMYGAMYVVDDLEAYLADAETYLAAHPLPAKDELLKFNRPRKEWKYEELASAIEHLDHGRSYANGKQMFTVANCISCHKFNGVGVEMGPDLTKVDPKLKPVDILKDVLEPSFRINDKYHTFIIETSAGKVITGLVIEETPDVLKVVENPLAKTPPIILKRGDVLDRKKSPNSIMPKGLLDKLTRDEILDLMAYVLAKGDEKHKYFQGAHEHHKH